MNLKFISLSYMSLVLPCSCDSFKVLVSKAFNNNKQKKTVLPMLQKKFKKENEKSKFVPEEKLVTLAQLTA